ncbi:haloacid dehalogenase [Mycena haematopus]|nr:haloacid dehalogenase [Mycena haematopus]
MAQLTDVNALLFDVFGTVVDWHGSATRELERLGGEHTIDADWNEFATTWRRGYYLENTRRIAKGGTGPLSVDVMHREILQNMLDAPQWKLFGDKLTNEARDELNLIWHRLDGLYALKKEVIIATLSKGNVRLLLDIAKHADLPWDTIFSAELFDSFEPDPKVYLGAIKHLSLEPRNCAMVSCGPHRVHLVAEDSLRALLFYLSTI